LHNEVKKYIDNISPDLIDVINKAQKIAVIGHVDPDGDSISSQLALSLALSENKKKVDAILDGAYEIRYVKENKKKFVRGILDKYDLYIVVDTPTIQRTGRISKDIDLKKTIVIDHHITNTNFGVYNWVDSQFLSTSEMIYLLLKKMNIKFDSKINQHLLNGIISDSGFFSHIRNGKHLSLLVSYLLISEGADPSKSYKLLFGRKSLADKKMLGLVLSRIEYYNKKILWTYVSYKEDNDNNKFSLDSLSVFREMQTISDAEMCVFFKEYKNKVDISLRSDGKVDVAEIASFFGGGGHKEAAGFSVCDSLENIREKVLMKSDSYLNNSKI